MLNTLLNNLVSRLSTFWLSMVRTIAPIIAGHVIGWLALHGMVLDSAAELALAEAIFIVASIAWYAIGRSFETLGHRYNLPALATFGGLMNGLPAPPTYAASRDAIEARGPPLV